MNDGSTMHLKDLNVVVTGAARGLGAALALTLSDWGCNVILCGRSQDALNTMASQIENRTRRKPASFIVDLADSASVDTGATISRNHGSN